MTLPALHNTGVLYRRILSQFPQDISLAFAYGSGVFKQHGTNQGQMEVSDTCPIGLCSVHLRSHVGYRVSQNTETWLLKMDLLEWMKSN